MSRKVKGSALLGVLVAAVSASQARAAFTYDLRFAPGQNVAGATFVDSHNVNITQVGGTYTVQLWAQISGNTSQTDDAWLYGYVNSVGSLHGSGGAFSAGGLNAASATNSTHLSQSNPGFQTGTGGADINSDGINDWGNSLSSSTVKAAWFKWGGGAAPGYVGPAAGDSESERFDANTWEVLAGTFTITPGGALGSDHATTTFTPQETFQVKLTSTSTVSGSSYFIDQLTTQSNVLPGNLGLTFTAVLAPEPASLGFLALGGLSILARRRRAR